MPAWGRTAAVAAAAAAVGAGLAAVVWRAGEPERDSPPDEAATPRILFDDFAEESPGALAASGWTVRTTPGEPGIEGARWSAISLVPDPEQPGGRLLRLPGETDGTAAGTSQAQVCRLPRYREGTTAARIRLRDEPVAGPVADAPAQVFAALGRFAGSRGEFGFTYRAREPVLEVASPTGEARRLRGSREGWHVLLAQVTDGRIAYYVDRTRVAVRPGRTHGGAAAITLGLWFDAVGAGAPRRWEADVDWVFHQVDAVLSPADVEAVVDSLRRIGVGFQDTVVGEPARTRLAVYARISATSR